MENGNYFTTFKPELNTTENSIPENSLSGKVNFIHHDRNG